MKLLHYGESIPLQRKNCFLAAALCSSVTKRGEFAAAASEDRRVGGTRRGKDLGIWWSSSGWSVMFAVDFEGVGVLGAQSLTLAVSSCFPQESVLD